MKYIFSFKHIYYENDPTEYENFVTNLDLGDKLFNSTIYKENASHFSLKHIRFMIKDNKIRTGSNFKYKIYPILCNI